jgi:predicted enzyme related to lactoylglutathione lyase
MTVDLRSLPKPRICYLQIPAIDAHQSAAFYEKVFGWNIRHRDTPRPSFDDASEIVSGCWETGWEPSRKAGLLPSIYVESIDATLALVVTNGGKVVESPHPD